MTTSHEPTAATLPPSPWVRVDDHTIRQTADLLEGLTRWLREAATQQTADLAEDLSDGDTDPIGIASWTDCLAARLRRYADGGEL